MERRGRRPEGRSERWDSRRGAAMVTVAALAFLGGFGGGCDSPRAPDSGEQVSRWETVKQPLATLEPPTTFRGLATGFDDSTAVIGFGIDGTIWSSQAVGAAAFSSPRRIDTGAPRFARGPALALAPGGVAVAAWEQPDLDHFQGPMLVWANRLSPGSGWSGPTLVERRVTAPEQVDPVAANLAPDVAVFPSGEAAVVWAAREVFASVSPDGRTWGEPEKLDTLGALSNPHLKEPRVVAGARGRFAAAWANGPDGRVTWREPDSGWGSATTFRVAPELVMDGPRLAADVSGPALVAWQVLEEYSSGFFRGLGVFAAVWSERSGWGPLLQVSSPGIQAYLIDVVLDGTGGGAVVWWDADQGLWVSRLSAAGAWAPPELVPRAKALPSATVYLAGGDLLTVWGDGPAVRTSRKSGTAWSPPETLQDGRPDPLNLIDRISLAASVRGEALAVWTRYEDNARGTLWTSRLRTR